MNSFDRRQFLQLASVGGAVFVSGLGGVANAADASTAEDFFFVQLSDLHWGFEGAPNPDARGTLPKAIASVNALTQVPDFVIFTGDLTHTTDDPKERRKRMGEVRDIIRELKVKTVRFIPGEHDASLDNGKAYKEFFGATNYTFEHKGVHFIVLDNVSDPAAKLGDEQLAWLADDLKKQAKDARIVVFAHRPLFDQRDGVLRPHPPGTSPHDRPHPPSLGQVADLPVAGGRLTAQTLAPALGPGAALPRARLPRGRSRQEANRIRHHRIPGSKGLMP